ncbi:HesA/MoeB/ThiF family protein [Aestuariibius sp. 2305UL40-4]|uniref:ThiF family adenylyltransferase n=1 Tax=Aestuariibius violaceus TaxID=3234132 RepID=UPI00345E8C45
MFDYSEFTTRNLGFVTGDEQQMLRDGHVFVCGTGGMGGAAILALARAGVGRMTLSDIDSFEMSNLNRQVFAWTDTIGVHKAEATAEQLRRINPDIQLEVLHDNWADQVDRIVADAQVVINGTDDLGASLLLYRTAHRTGRPVIDSYASPLPSVYVTGPDEPAPELRLGYPTRDTAWNALTDAQRDAAFQAEAEYVLTHSSSAFHIDLALAGEVAAGRRSRMSFAPMVITSGMLMGYEAIAALIGRKTRTDCRGWFLNPYAARVERPRNPAIAALIRPIVRRKLKRMMAE